MQLLRRNIKRQQGRVIVVIPAIWNSLEYIMQIFKRFETMQLGGFEKAVENSGGISSGRASRKQLVFPVMLSSA